MSQRFSPPELAELVGLGFHDEAGQHLCLDALHQHSPESYRALPGRFSVIFERKDLEWLQRYLERRDIPYIVEPVIPIAKLSAEEATQLRSGRYERLRNSKLMNEKWVEAEIKRLSAEFDGEKIEFS